MKSTAPSPFFPARRALFAALLAIAAPLAFLALAQTQSSTSPQPPNEEQTSPFARVDGTNIYVYKALTPENLTNYLLNPLGPEALKDAINTYLNANIESMEFGQTREQLKKVIEESYKLAAENVDEDGFSVAYPLNREQLDEVVGIIEVFPIIFQIYIGEPKKEDGKIYLVPSKEGNVAYISTGIISDPNTKTKEDPYCDYEILLESTMNPETGEIKETQILPKRRTTYNTPYNEEGIKDLERYGYDTISTDSTTRRYLGTGHKDIDKNLSKIKSYIVGCIIKEGDIYNIYFSPPTIWRIHPGEE